MHRLAVAVISMITLGVPGISQPGALSGIVRDSVTAEPVAGATVVLEGTGRGGVTSPEGTFTVSGLAPGTYRLRVSCIGYAKLEREIRFGEGDSLVVELLLLPEEIESEEVVITATRTIRNIADVPVRVEAIPEEEVEEKLLMTPSSVAMLLNESTGMRMQTTSAASNTANLRIQGQSGRYTQILIDGIPSFGGLASGFGLTQIPPLNLRQVEVIKGATSALYGADAISGVVNFITKDPGPEPEFSAIANATTQEGTDLAAFAARRFGDVGVTLLGSRNTQALFDVDADGFGDVAEYNRFTVTPKLLLSPSEDIRLKASAGILSEDRTGGSVSPPAAPAAAALYVERAATRRIEASSQLDWVRSPGRGLAVKASGMSLRRDASYGGSAFNATQRVFTSDAQYSFGIPSHALLFGAAFNLEEYTDRTPGVGTARDYRYDVPAVFAQDEISVAERWTLLASGRIDFHNRLGTILTPRVSMMFRPSPSLTVRAGGGTGFKAPTIFVEEAEETGFRNVRPYRDVGAEKAASGSFDVNWRAIIGDVGAIFNLALFVSDLSHALIADPDSLDAGVVVLRSATGATSSRGGECSAKLAAGDFKLSLGYTYLYAVQTDRGQTAELERNPRHSLGAVMVWESAGSAAKVGVENYWTGAQRLERNPYRDRSPDYWITGVIAEKSLGRIRLFLNFENIFDTRQSRFEPVIAGGHQAGSFRALPVYAPLEGRVINGGIRFVL